MTFLESTARRYGDIVRFQLGRKDIYLVSDANLIGQVLQRDKSEDTTSAFNATMRSVFGEGLLTLRGAAWRSDRQLLQPAFTKRAAVNLTPLFVDETQRRLKTWIKKSAVEVAEEMRLLTAGVTTRLLFGSAITDVERLVVYRALSVINRQLFKQLLVPQFARIPTSGNATLRRAIGEIDAIVDRAVRCQAHGDGELECFPLAQYLRSRIASRRRLRDHLITLLFAGQETTANALAWCLYLIAEHPDAAHTLKAEQESVLEGALPTSDGVAHLKYTRAVIGEAMRLYPPSYVLTPRNGDEPLVGAYVVPPHAQLIISQYVMHRHPDHWEQPEAFRPERFGAARPKFAYFPFGAGPQVCIGAAIAMQEMCTVLAMVIQAFRLKMVTQTPVVPQARITLRPRDGVWVKLDPA